MSIIIGIDVGGSTTKIVGFDGKRLLNPQLVKATDPVASIYGAFGKFTSENDIALSNIDRVMMTGVGSTFVDSSIYGLKTIHVNEFDATGRGGLYLSELEDAIIVSMGTGTALVHANSQGITHLGGTGVGGGTLIGLAKKMLAMQEVEHISELAKDGNLANVDLRIEDITEKVISPSLSASVTASNFGKLSDIASKSDIALGIINLVFETIAMMSIFSARQKNIREIVLTGNLSVIPQCKGMFTGLGEMFGVHFSIPQNSTFATVVGTALTDII
ncbi:MAG: pantothenate kinase [Clostridiales bacterium GWF2_36_10]|nr:MAG: pantothenate kinase [Clostridiales bacterium GWF2_36_10]HAN21429.1 type II pantothenate kinase [Clostridiales bacterium]